MDLITAIINDKSKRRKVKAYLKEIDLGDFLAMQSFGTYGLLNPDNSFRHSIDVAFDDKFDMLNRGKILVVINNSQASTQDIIDHIYDMINDGKQTFNTGIIFSVPINDIFKQIS